MDKTVLIVDDEKSIVNILKFNLESAGFTTVVAYDGKTALKTARTQELDLILLDVMLPGINGFEVCRTLRSEGSSVPIIMITAREEETDKVLGLELGADDYITKPFSNRELVARANANLRRATKNDLQPPSSAADVVDCGEIVIDLRRHVVFKNGVNLDLTEREYELLKFMASQPGRIVSRQELLSEVWKYDFYGDLRAVDVAVRRLREKIEDNPAEPRHVLTKRGAGYFFRDATNQDEAL